MPSLFLLCDQDPPGLPAQGQLNASGANASALTRGACDADGENYAFDDDDLVTLEVDLSSSSTVTTSRTKEVKTYKFITPATGDVNLDYLQDVVNTGGTITTPTTKGFEWLNTNEMISVRAWSYGNKTNYSDPTEGNYVLTTDQETNGYNEVLYFSGDRTYGSDGKISVPLQHMLSRIVVNVYYDDGSTLDGITIGDGAMSLPKTATFDPTKANPWTIVGTTEKETIIPKEETQYTCYSAVLIPTTYAAGGNFINITIGSETFHYVIPTGGITLASGKQYNYDITIKNRAITFTVTVTQWENYTRPIDFSE